MTEPPSCCAAGRCVLVKRCLAARCRSLLPPPPPQGVTHYALKDDHFREQLQAGEAVSVIAEPDNAVDSEALMVTIRGQHVGQVATPGGLVCGGRAANTATQQLHACARTHPRTPVCTHAPARLPRTHPPKHARRTRAPTPHAPRTTHPPCTNAPTPPTRHPVSALSYNPHPWSLIRRVVRLSWGRYIPRATTGKVKGYMGEDEWRLVSTGVFTPGGAGEPPIAIWKAQASAFWSNP